MNSRTFFEKVSLMREAQKDYFRTRTQQALQQSKALEAEIDREISRVRAAGFTPPPQPRQPNLFSPTT